MATTVRRRWLIGISLVVHLGVVIGLFIAGFWHLDRLDAGKRRFELSVAPSPPPPPAGGAAAAPESPFKLKQKKIVKERTQLAKIDRTAAPVTAEVPGNRSGSGSDDQPCTGPDCGVGSGSDGPPTGACVGPACPGAEQIDCSEASSLIVPPSVIKGMRISGETQILPSDVDKIAIQRSGKTKIIAGFKVCVGPKGNVESLSLSQSSGFPAWDAAITTALRQWRYRPYQLTPAQQKPRDPRCPPLPAAQSRAVTVCGVVSFIYQQQ